MHDKYKPRLPFDPSRASLAPSEDPFLKRLNEEIEENARRNEYVESRGTWLKMITEGLQEFHEQQLFQNLMPEFDRIPMKRALMACVYSPRGEEGLLDPSLESRFAALIQSSGTELIWQYPPLRGSRLYRCTLRTTHRQTRKEFENSYGQVGEELTQCLQQEEGGKITVVNNFHIGTAPTKERRKDWAEQLKDLTEAMKNLVLIGAGLCLMIDGTFVRTPESGSQDPAMSILKVPRDKEVEILSKILEATTAQEFREAVEPLKPESLHGKKHTGKGGRRFR